MIRKPAALLSLALAGSAPLHSAELVLTLDPARSSVRFVLDATAHEVLGTLALGAGEIRLDPVSGRASGTISVDATSARTGNAKRDRTMHEKVLESSAFPRFVFHAESVEGALPASGTAALELHGRISIHGGDHPLTLPAEVRVEGDRIEATSRFTIPYVEWGMRDPSFFLLRVAKRVEVTVTTEGHLAPAGAAAPAPGAR